MSNAFDPTDLCFSPEPSQRALARELYAGVADLPIVGPHGHVEPRLLADPEARLGNPAELFIIPDHYVFRMLYSRGIALEELGVPARDGTAVERDPRAIWRRFAENAHLFRGTPTGLWLAIELREVFGIDAKLGPDTADEIYDALEAKLAQDDFRPRALLQRFRIETLATTDAATDDLAWHARLRERGAGGTTVRPTFRPDGVIDPGMQGWHDNVRRLGELADVAIVDMASFLEALRRRRAFFEQMGATATDHASRTADVVPLSDVEAEAVFERALSGQASGDDAQRFVAHMLWTMAAMSVEDGLVMQLHVGSLRNHNRGVYRRFGLDKGADIPLSAEFTRALRPLLNGFGNDPRYRLILFTLDETVYGRELAPLAGHYPAVLLGPPWWFFDSVKGMERWLDAVMETAGAYNTAGFNDDTRAFASIPARHQVWRRVTCNWLANAVLRGLMDEEDGRALARAFAYDLAKDAYRLS